MAAKKKAKRTIGKKDMKKTKGGLLPAVNLQEKWKISSTINLDPAINLERFK